MVSISSIAKQNYMLFSIMQKTNSASTDPSDWIASLSGKTSKTSGTSSDWLSRSISSRLSAGTTGADLSEIIAAKIAAQKSDIQALEKYSKDSTAFYKSFESLSSGLKKSASALSSADFTPAEGQTKLSAEETAAVVSSTKTFAADYNALGKFFSDNASLSPSLKNLATSFSEAKYNRQGYAAIGINVDNAGRLTVDEAKLTSSLQESPKAVSQLIGKDGLAGKASKKTAAAVNLSTQLYPSLTLQSGKNSLNTSGLLAGLTLDFYW